MKEGIPKCKDCGQPMFVVIENIVTLKGSGMPVTLYQCPEDKTIATL